MAMDLGLFAHINSDALIAGTRNLEGRTLPQRQEAVHFLDDFLHKEARTFLPAEVLKENTENFKHLSYRLTSLVQAETELGQNPDASALVNRILKLDPKKDLSVLMPGGWTGTPGHAMIYEFQKDKNGDLIFMVYNSGGGLETFHKGVPQIDKLRYETMKCFKIPKKQLVQSKLSYFIQALVQVKFSSEKNADAKYLYEYVIKQIAFLQGKEVEPESVKFASGKKNVSNVSMAQRAGTCVQKSLHQLIKNDITDSKVAKLILLCLKIHSIEIFLEQEKENLNTKSLEQLQFATANLSTILLKNKNIPQNVYDRAQAVISKVALLNPNEVAQFLKTPEKNIFPENFRPFNIDPCGVESPIRFSANDEITIKKRAYLAKKQEYAVKAIDGTIFSLDKLVEFNQHMEKLIKEGHEREAEKQIAFYLTNFPLDKNYLASIDTPKKAIVYIDTMHQLFIKYNQYNCNANLTPEKSIALLSVLESMDLLLRDPKISIHLAGIDALRNYSGSSSFSSFKKDIYYNAHLATGSPLMDNRFKAILNRIHPKISVFSRGNVDLYYLKEYLEKTKNVALNRYLKKMYAEKSESDFTQEERGLIGKKGFEAVIAYLYYLEDFPDKYTVEAEKVTFFKKSVALFECSARAGTLGSLGYFSEGSNNLKRKKPVIVEGNRNHRYLSIQYLTMHNIKLNKEILINYFNKIKDSIVDKCVSTDFDLLCREEYREIKRKEKMNEREINFIFSKLNGGQVPEGGENQSKEESHFYQELRHLKLVPSLQFLTTLDFFSDRFNVFSKRRENDPLPSDAKEYLRRMLFQPSVIIEALKNNPKALDCFNQFIDRAILYFEDDFSNQIYFYQLQSDVNRYVSKIDLDHDKRFAGLKQSIERVQYALSQTLSKMGAQEISALDRYTIAKIKLQIKLDKITEEQKKDPEFAKGLFDLFIEFGGLSRECVLASNELREEHQRLKESCLEALFLHQDHIYEWALKDKIEGLTQKGEYPYYYAVNDEGKVCFSIDLMEGQILNSNRYETYPPSELANSEIWKKAMGERLPKLVVTLGANKKQYEVLNSTPKQRFIEYIKEERELFRSHTVTAFAYQKEMTVQGQTGFYEQQIVKDLPESFHGKETICWRALDGSGVFIEQNDHKYHFDLNSWQIQELDEHNQPTGFILNEHPGWFNKFEDEKFTQVLLKTEATGVQSVKIHFLRYNLSLEGHFDAQQNKWLLHPVGKPNLILVDALSQTKPQLNNSLVFESIDKKEKIIYTPNQYYYANKKEERDRPEASFSTVYHDSVLDRTKVYKRILVGLEVPELDIPSKKEAEKFPAGPQYYANSEDFFVYGVDPKTNAVIANSTDAQLYLVYNSLLEHQPETALMQVQALTKLGGLKGTAKELEVIQKILEGAPLLGDPIGNPKYIAVRTQLLYHCSVLMTQKEHFSIPNSKSLPDSTPDEYTAKKHIEMLEKFQSSLAERMLNELEVYHSTKIHIPLEMQLTPSLEYQFLRKLAIKNTDSVQLKARYLVLKREHLIKEKERILSLGKQSEAKHQGRLAKIDKSLEKKQTASVSKMKLGKITKTVELMNTTDYKEIRSNPSNNVLDFNPNMSNEDFESQFDLIYKIAKSRFHPKHGQLKKFLNQTVEATASLQGTGKNALAKWAPTLLVVARHPGSFLFKEDRQSVAQRAYEISPKIKIETMGYLETPTTLDITPKKREDELYLKPVPIAVLLNDTVYQAFNYDIFIKENQLSDFNNEVEALKIRTEQSMEALKEELRLKIKGKRYIETVDLVEACDEKVGRIKNEEMIEKSKITQKYLKDLNLRNNILTKVSGWIPILSQRAKDNQAQALALANRGPLEPEALKKYQLERSAGIRKKLKLSDLNRLFILSDFNEYRKVTGLDRDEDIQNLHDSMARSIHFSILKTHYKKVRKSIVETQTLDFDAADSASKIMQLGNMLTDRNGVPPTEAALQFFQKEEKILMKPMQIAAFKQLVSKNPNTGEFNNVIIQMIMGAGKTKVIAPTTALMKANGSNLVIQQVKSSLLKVAYADECAKSHRLYNRVPLLFEFERTPMDFSSSRQSALWKILYHDLKNVMLEKNFMMTSGPSLQSLELQYLDTLDQPPPTNEKERTEWLRQIKILEKMLTLMLFHGDRIIDEIHEELDPIKALNHTLGLPESASKEDLQLHVDLFFFFKKIKVNSISSEKTVYDLILDNTLISNPEVQVDQIMQAIALGLIQDQSEANPLAGLAKKLNLNDKQKEDFVQYITNKKLSPEVSALLNQLTPREREDIAWIKFELSKVLPFTMLKNYNEHYGASKLPALSELQKRLAIPYTAIYTPNEKARFGQFLESLSFTTQLNIKEPLTDALIEEIIQSYLAQVKYERMESPGMSFEETQASQDFNRLFCKETQTTLYAISMSDKTERNAIVQDFKQSEAFLKATLSEKILPLVKIDKHVLSSDNQNLGSMTNTTEGMSATPSNYRAYPSDIIFDEVGSIGTDGETIDQLKRKETKVAVCDEYGSDEKLFAEAMANCSQAPDVRALIDIGGLFKNTPSNEVIAMKIANFYEANNIASKRIKHVLYFDNTDNNLYAWDTEHHKKIFLGSSDEKEISKILKCDPDERFTFYDQARITGTDIVQAPKAHALVTISEKTTQPMFLQGLKRLRRFSEDQSATIICPRYIMNRVQPNIESVLKFVGKNRSDKYLQMHLRGASKKFRNAVRKDLLRKVYAEKDLRAKAKLFAAFRSIFVTDHTGGYFEQYGAIDQDLKSTDYFRQFESLYYNKWIECLDKANMSVPEEEKSKMKALLTKTSADAVLACADTIKGVSESGLEVENENEVENELQLEKLTVVYDESLKPNLSDSNFSLATGLKGAFIGVIKRLALWLVAVKNAFYALIYKIVRKPFNPTSVALSLFDNLVPANSDFVLKNDFDSNIFISSKQLWTLENGAPRGKRLKDYHNGYVKPAHVIMMVASKLNPKKVSECVILTTQEADAYIKNGNEALEKRYSNHHVWFISPNETLLGGTPPKTQPENFTRMLEQARFINGDIKQILQ